MTVHWTLYDEVTGAIIASGDTLDTEMALLQATGGGRIVLVDSDPNSQIVTNPGGASPVVTNKPATSGMVANKTSFLANGTDTVTIPSIPAGSVAKVVVPANLGIADIANFTINDGSLVITTTVAGSYTITITPTGKADYTVTLNAT